MTNLVCTAELKQLENEIKKFKSTIAISILEIGDRLLRAKEMLRHGEFITWVEDNIKLSQRTANNYMRAATVFYTVEKRKSVSDFNSTTVIMLAELPDSVREDFMKQTDVTQMSTRDLKEAVQKEKASAELKQYFAQSPEEQQETFEIEISKLKPNPNLDPFGLDPYEGKNYTRFLNSIKQYGLFSAIMITKNNVIINGHERVRAMKDLGYKTIKARYVYVPSFYEGETFDMVCLRTFAESNRWDHTRSEDYHFFNWIYQYCCGNLAEAEKELDIYQNHGQEIHDYYEKRHQAAEEKLAELESK